MSLVRRLSLSQRLLIYTKILVVESLNAGHNGIRSTVCREVVPFYILVYNFN